MIEFELPTGVSHSALNSYLRCGKAYELGKLGVPEAPAWWLIGGSAVHKATEWLDKGEWDLGPETAFYTAFNNEIFDAVDIEPDQDKWRKAGYGSRAQGYDHWMELGPRYVKQWLNQTVPWTHAELDVTTELPSGIKIRGYVDRVLVHGHDEAATIYDLKTGSTRPDSDQQLGIYSVLTSLKLRIPVTVAYNYMFKDDEFYQMDVSNWTLETIDEMAQEWYRGVSSGVFIPNRGKNCGTCGVSEGCFLSSGDTATTRRFDRLNPNYGK